MRGAANPFSPSANTPHPNPRTHRTPLASSALRPARGEGLFALPSNIPSIHYCMGKSIGLRRNDAFNILDDCIQSAYNKGR
ncbi:hypothetical protein [Azospirillum doebereinerae]